MLQCEVIEHVPIGSKNIEKVIIRSQIPKGIIDRNVVLFFFSCITRSPGR